MKKYIKPNLEKIYIENLDIIKTSGEIQSFKLSGVNTGNVDFSEILSYGSESVNIMD